MFVSFDELPPHWLQLFLQLSNIHARFFSHSPKKAQKGQLEDESVHSAKQKVRCVQFVVFLKEQSLQHNTGT